MGIRGLFSLLFLLTFYSALSQYILNGSASKNSCNCYTITPPSTFQNGSVWNSNKINLSQSFDFSFNVFLGCSDQGADGIVFMLQPLSTSIGSAGEGMGFQGVIPSIGIALDTYQNTNQNDPSYDHVSIQANGNINHSSDLAGPVTILASGNNVEDCQWHVLRITWDASTHWLRAYFDQVIRVEKQLDLVATIFANDPMVYWGFSGATGGEVNLQQFCTALNPDFKTNLTGDGGCAPSTVQFSDQSISFTAVNSYNWDFDNGFTSSLPNPPPQQYTAPGVYRIRLKVRGLDGCEKDTVKIITIGSSPQASFSINDTCYKKPPVLTHISADIGIRSEWWLDGSQVATDALPDLNSLSVGSHQLELRVSSLFGCGSNATKSESFTIEPIPQLTLDKAVDCKSIRFVADQINQTPQINSWQWDFGDGKTASTQSPMHVYADYGSYTAKLWAIGNNGCSSDTLQTTSIIDAPIVFAGTDTVVLMNIPFQLNGRGNGSLSWSPAALVSDATVSDPLVTLTADQAFVLTVTTPENCIASDDVFIKVMKGPAVYVPTAFTPNGDGRNDVLKPIFVGVQLKKFFIYNRWGQLVFSTTTNSAAWNGKLNGVDQNGTFVWMIEAIDYQNKPLILKGTVTIIR